MLIALKHTLLIQKQTFLNRDIQYYHNSFNIGIRLGGKNINTQCGHLSYFCLSPTAYPNW